jgi:phage shock protein PspC (stress-responsive transcriptional regulator)
MKKIITINLSGRVLQIEEPAYEQLQQYIASLRNYFSKEESREEIINDIEGRIAEQFYGLIQQGAACITEAHLTAIIAAMGKPEELADAEILETTATAGNDSSFKQAGFNTTTAKREFFRDANTKVLGGVAAGIANFIGIDPVIIRVLFVLLSFSSFGLVALGYILLWILVPAKELEDYRGRRFYRNPDDRVLAGVASGIAAYFNVSTRNIRLLFLAPLLLQILFSVLDIFDDSALAEILFNVSFGSLLGFSVILYIILWVILPTAETSYQKMEMRGEKINLERIRQYVSEEGINKKMEEWGKDVELTAKQLSAKVEELAKEAKQKSRISRPLRLIGLFFKILFVLFFGGIAIVLLIVLLALLFGGIVSWPLQHYIWSSAQQQVLAWATFALFLLVPVIGFIIWLIRRLINTKAGHTYLSWTFGGLWALGWVAVVLFASSLSRDFRYQEKKTENIALPTTSTNKMMVTVTEPELEYSGSFSWIDGDPAGWDLTPDTLKLSNILIKVEPSRDSNYQVQLIRMANGRDEQEAGKRADAIRYQINTSSAIGNYSVVEKNKKGDTITHLIKDRSYTLVDLGNGYSIPASAKYRAQQVRVIIRVPVGGRISFDESVRSKLSSFEVKIRQRTDSKYDRYDWTEHNFRYRSNIEYIMGADGELKAADGSDAELESMNIELDLPVPPNPETQREAMLLPRSKYYPVRVQGPSPLRLLLG